MRATIAANAALLGLGHTTDLYRNVTAVVVHPRTMVLRGERRGPSPGVMTRAPQRVGGHTSATGPVFIAWNDVERGWRDQGLPRNVVLHEFAHKIDALTGTLDGTPPVEGRAQRQQWIDVCTGVYEAVRGGRGPSVLRGYAGRTPAEFFAVTTEVFFERPHHLRAADEALYDVFAAFYRQDPCAREPAPVPDPAEEPF